MVSHDGGKVDLVKAPLDRAKPVTKMTTREANHMGLQTQDQAREMASHNRGFMGSKKAVTVENNGIGSRRNSYSFKQTAPAAVIEKQYGATYKTTGITRTVTVTGSGETAIPGNMKRLDTPTGK
jgi:hypothetical protein